MNARFMAFTNGTDQAQVDKFTAGYWLRPILSGISSCRRGQTRVGSMMCSHGRGVRAQEVMNNGRHRRMYGASVAEDVGDFVVVRCPRGNRAEQAESILARSMSGMQVHRKDTNHRHRQMRLHSTAIMADQIAESCPQI